MNNDQVFEYVKGLDQELDTYSELAFKIKDREVR